MKLSVVFHLLFIQLVLVSNLFATEQWQFNEKQSVSGASEDGIFHHLEGSGRKHIAFSGNSVGVIWEDNRTNDPQIYFSSKNTEDLQFSSAVLVSNKKGAYEPGIAALSEERFALIWEQDSAVYVNTIFQRKLGTALKLSKNVASHGAIATSDGKAFAVWREQEDNQWLLRVAELDLLPTGDFRQVFSSRVEAENLPTPVLYPSIVYSQAGIGIAWEDRRAGHTRLLYSHSADGREFSQPENLNEFYSNRNQYDKGNGVTRVSLALFSEEEVVAAWMDKRRSGGYGIFSSLGDGGGMSYGPNEKVHGEKGDKKPHYNPSVAGNLNGEFIIVWDDFRNDNSDIWISNYDDSEEEWSQDYSPTPASGSFEQSHASVALDEENRLHLVWIEREDINASTGIWYSLGVPLVK